MESNNNNFNLQNQINSNIQINQQNINVNELKLERKAFRRDVVDLYWKVCRRMNHVWGVIIDEYNKNEQKLSLTSLKRDIVDMFKYNVFKVRDGIFSLKNEGLKQIKILIKNNEYTQAKIALEENKEKYRKILERYNKIVAANNNDVGKLETNCRLILRNAQENELVYNAADLEQYRQELLIELNSEPPLYVSDENYYDYDDEESTVDEEI